MKKGDYQKQVFTVQRIDRSPMNSKVWIVQLSCGHDRYVSGRKPSKRTMQMECDKCPMVRTNQ